jgi:hypothetical protein
MKESILAVIVLAVVVAFGSALNQKPNYDLASDTLAGPRLIEMVQDGQVKLAPYPSEGRSAAHAAGGIR